MSDTHAGWDPVNASGAEGPLGKARAQATSCAAQACRP